MAPQSSAVNHVFDTFELLELILMQLDLLDLFRVQGINRRTRSVIRGSPPLQRKLYLQPDLRSKTSLRSKASAKLEDHSIPGAPGGSSFPLEPVLFNPLLPRLCGYSRLSTKKLENDWLLFSASSFLGREEDVGPSWRSTLLTSQALTHLRMEPAGLLFDRSCSPPYFIAAPNPAEAERLAALHFRLSNPRATNQFVHRNRERFAGADRPSPIPVATSRKLAAARGEASQEGWVWGQSLDFVKGRKPASGGEHRKIAIENPKGITLGDVDDVMRKARWSTWVIKGLDQYS